MDVHGITQLTHNLGRGYVSKADLVSKHEGHLTLTSHGWKEEIAF